MKLTRNLTIAVTTLAFSAMPAVALAGGPGKSGSAPGQDKTTTTTTTTSSSPMSPTEAYGRFCNSESRKHVDGEKGTPFSLCVVALAHANKSAKTTAREACDSLSKKHVENQKGTPYSECIQAVAKLRKSS